MSDNPAIEPKPHTIWKYPLELTSVQTIQLPKHAQFRLVADQSGILTLWYEVDSEHEMEDKQVVIVGTGHEVPGGLIHLGSVIQGHYVWHVYSVPSLGDLFGRMAGIF